MKGFGFLKKDGSRYLGEVDFPSGDSIVLEAVVKLADGRKFFSITAEKLSFEELLKKRFQGVEVPIDTLHPELQKSWSDKKSKVLNLKKNNERTVRGLNHERTKSQKNT